MHLALALDGAGWHPAAWREDDARPRSLLTPTYWVDLVRQAERGLIDFVTFEDALRLQSDHPFRPDSRIDRVRGQLDSVLIASRVAPLTSHIGLVPTVVVTHTEPFHISKAIATLDFVSGGRAAVRVRVSSRDDEAAHFGRRSLSDGSSVAEDLFYEAEDYVEVVRRLWDSWEDDAEIRDVASGRFIDRDKLHYIDFSGRWFSVRGPSITPRPPQAQPPVAALAHASRPYQLVARSTDLGFVTPLDRASATSIVDEIRAEEQRTGRPPGSARLLADVVVFLDYSRELAAARLSRLDDLVGRPYRSDAVVFAGTPAGLVDLLEDLTVEGLAGFRLRPGAIPHDTDQIAAAVVPELQRRGLFRTAYGESTLRARLGLERPANRYTVAAGTEVSRA